MFNKFKSFFGWVAKDVKEGNMDRAKEKIVHEVEETKGELQEKLIKDITAMVMKNIEVEVEKQVRKRLDEI